MSKPMTVARYAKEHRGWFYGCLLLFALVAFFCLKAIYDMTVYGAKAPLYAFTAGMVGFGATALGSLPGFYFHKLSDKAEDWMLGSSAGMMLAAAIFSLLLPSIDASEKLFTSELAATLWVLFGVFLGVVFLLIINALTPHEHADQTYEGPEIEVKSGIWLFVLAIIIHNIPEGLAMGISFSAKDMQIGVPLTIAIALQDFPEGLAVVLALCTTNISRGKAVAIGVFSGLMEPVGALFGVSLAGGLGYVYPLGLALSAGAMMFVVFHEVIPETRRRGHHSTATIGLMCGFGLMMILEKIFS